MATILPNTFVPTSISGCTLWLDAKDLSTITATAGSVSAWRDKSTNAYTVSTATGTVSLVTGNTSYLSFAAGAIMTGPSISFGGSIFIVLQATQNSVGSTGMVFGLSGSDKSVRYGSDFKLPTVGDGNDVGQNGNYIVNGTQVTISNPALNTQVYIIYTPVINGFNGVFSLSNTFLSRYFIGNLYEIIIYNSSLTTAQRQQVEGYLAWKWGISTSLLTSQPFRYAPPNSSGSAIRLSAPITVPLQNFQPNPSPIVFFNPLTVSGAVMWLDGLDNSKLVLSGTSVTQWIDKTGYGYNMSTTSGTVTRTTANGFPVLSFPSGAIMSSVTVPFSGSVFIVCQPTQQSGQGLNMLIGQSGSDLSIRYDSTYKLINPGNNSDIGAGGAYIINGTSIGTTNPSLNTQLNIIYTPIVFGFSGVATISNTFMSRYFIGNMCEILLFSSSLSTTNRQLIEGYLAWKWGIQGSLPASHPYKNTIPGNTILTTIPANTNMRSASFRPTSISGCILWLDAADPNGSGVLPTLNSVLSSWVDKSGQGNTLNASGSPTFTTYQSKYAIYFNSNWFSNSASYSVANTTIFIVFDIPTAANNQSYIQIGADANSTSGNTTTIFADANVTKPGGVAAGRIYFGSGGGSGLLDIAYPTATSSDAIPYCFQTIRISSTPIVQNYTNGSLQAQKTGSVTRASHTNISIPSATAGWQTTGYISEVIIYNSVLSDTNKQNVEGYLAWKWGLQGNLPAASPWKKFPPAPN